MRLQVKVLLVVIPLAVVPLLILGLIAYHKLQSTSIERTRDQMTTLVEQLATNFEVRTAVAEANIRLFADAPLMRAYAVTADEEERYSLMHPSLLKLFKSYLRAYPDYNELRFLLPDGFEDARATLKPIPNATEEEGNTPFFRALSKFDGEVFSRVLTNPDDGETVLQVAHPLKLINIATDDPLGTLPKLRGYLVVTVDLGFVAEQLAANRIGERGYALVVDKDMHILFHPDASAVGSHLPTNVAQALEGLDEDGAQGSAILHGEGPLLSARRIHDDLLLIGILPEAELLAGSRDLGMLVGWVTLATILLTIAALLIAINKLMVRPVNHLIEAVEEIAEGNLTPNIALSSRDELGRLALSFQDMGRSLEKSREKVERLAYHDSLTGLPNRLLFREYLQHMIPLARRENNKMAVLFLDLDNFKRVNDTLGHQVGDRLLREMATRLQSVLREEDFVYQETFEETSEVLARLGGDEFIILLPKIHETHDAAKVAARIVEMIKEPFWIDGHELYSTTSIGITLYPEDGTEVNDLIKRADAAMYHAKEQGRNNFQFYSASYNIAITEHLSLESRLRRAIGNDELELVYQPQVDGGNGRIMGFEALLRWNDPERGLILPDRFIPIAEDSGLILQIGEWVLHEACRQNQAWLAAGLPRVFVSVNVSSIQMQRQDFGAVVKRVLTRTGMQPDLLELEVTESMLMKVRQETVGDLGDLQQMGVRISLDDFGTGFSSLNRLRELPIGKLKIDRSFVQDMAVNSQDAAIVSAILFIAKSLSLETTAEGVETPEQAARLTAEGCGLLQGYLLSRPLTAAKAGELLNKNRETMSLKTPTIPSLSG